MQGARNFLTVSGAPSARPGSGARGASGDRDATHAYAAPCARAAVASTAASTVALAACLAAYVTTAGASPVAASPGGADPLERSGPDASPVVASRTTPVQARGGQVLPGDIVSPSEVRRIERHRERRVNTTSADWREGMTLGLALEVPSFAPWPGAGVAISAFVRPDFVLESAASAHFGQSMPSGSESYQAWLLQLHGRIFFGNSWNVSAGGALYSFNEVEDLEPAEEGGPEAHTDTTLVTSGLRFALGNHWQWSVATVGVDWIGVYVPFVAIQRDFRSEGLTSEERRRARNAFLKADLLPVPEFLKVRFGVSF